MSLNYDFTGMVERIGKAEYDRITDHPTQENAWHPVTDALIWVTMSIGMGEITEASADEFAERVLALQAVTGPLLMSGDGGIYVTPDDVRRHIGMTTNVFPKWPKTKFYAHLARLAVKSGEAHQRGQDASAFDVVAKRAAVGKENAA